MSADQTRKTMIESRAGAALAGPSALAQIVDYARKQPVLFSISAILIASIAWFAYLVFDWGIVRAVWHSPDSQLCRVDGAGACWAVIEARWRIIVFGLYPFEEQWRSTIACLLLMGTAVISCFPWFWSFSRIAPLWIAGFAGFTLFMSGGFFGLEYVPVRQWGGLSLTLFVFACVTILTMPLSVALVLMRQSSLYWVSKPVQVIIDFVRSLPLLVVMFVAAVVLPFGLPDALIGEKLFRVIAGFTFYNACYQAEILRGGLQSLPSGQDEAAKALGMGYWHRVSRITLPQAFKVTLPSTINQIVIVFLETPLIVIIGFFEVLASGNAAFGTAEWGIAAEEVYIFIGLIFFIFSFSLSRYGSSLETRLGKSDRR